jgi:hypothetical protein
LPRSDINSLHSVDQGAGGLLNAHWCSIAAAKSLKLSSSKPGNSDTLIGSGEFPITALSIVCAVLHPLIKHKAKKAIEIASYPIRLQFWNVGNLFRSIRRSDYGVINRLVDDEGQVVLMQYSWNAQHKLRNLRIEPCAIFGNKEIAAFHRAGRRFELATAGILERLTAF